MNTTGNEELTITDLSGGKIPLLCILDAEHNVVPLPESDIVRWGQWLNTTGNRRVAYNETGETSVSTVFIGMYPSPFETRVFGGPMDQHQVRYSTWDEAQQGHVETCRKVFV